MTATPDATTLQQGDTLTVTGDCWWTESQPGLSVSVGLRRDLASGSGKTVQSAAARADVASDGTYSLEIPLPETLLPDTYTGSGMCIVDDMVLAGSELGEFTITGIDSRPDFTDVAATNVHREAIREMAARGTTFGCADGRFCPSDKITRAQFASLLARHLELDLTDTNAPFVDVTGGEHAAAIAALARDGIVQGCSADRFCPRQLLRRDQVASTMARMTGLDVHGDPDLHPGFRDVTAGSHHDRNIRIMAGVFLTRGCAEDRYCPTDPLTRAQAARLLHRVDGGGD